MRSEIVRNKIYWKKQTPAPDEAGGFVGCGEVEENPKFDTHCQIQVCRCRR